MPGERARWKSDHLLWPGLGSHRHVTKSISEGKRTGFHLLMTEYQRICRCVSNHHILVHEWKINYTRTTAEEGRTARHQCSVQEKMTMDWSWRWKTRRMLGHTWVVKIIGLHSGLDVEHKKNDSGLWFEQQGDYWCHLLLWRTLTVEQVTGRQDRKTKRSLQDIWLLGCILDIQVEIARNQLKLNLSSRDGYTLKV